MLPKSANHPHRWRRITVLALLICAVVWMRFSQSAYVMAKVAIGEGGVLHSVGTVQATYNANAMEYEVYQGKARYSSGVAMEELLLLAKGKHDQEHFDFDTVLLGRERVFFPNGLLYLKWPFGVLPMTCLGRVSCAKALEVYSLDISQVSGTNRFALSIFESDGSHQKIIFEIPDDLWRSIPQNATYEAHSNNVDIVIAARAQIGVTTNYVADYRKIDYPNGDMPRGEGVCSDVIVRALRDARKIDLQELMHIDMSANFGKYPRKRKWLLGRPDSNIDHRRVLNQECFFTRQGWAVPVSTNRNDYLPGDFVTCRVYGLPHIMIVSDRRAHDGTPLIIHNIGSGTQEENALFSFQLVDHFRLPISISER